MKPVRNVESSPFLFLDRLQVRIPTIRGPVHALNKISFSLEKGRALGIVGESGCGKSILCKSILGLLPKGAVISGQSRIIFEGQVLNRLPERVLKTIRGKEIAMVFQDSMGSLNPVMTVGRQIAEPLVHHLGMGIKEALARARELMALTGIPQARLGQYPHQLSGGLRQRAAIAAALSCGPKLLIADEPTTALDVTVQAGILDLLNHLRREKSMAMILVTHDLGVAAENCQDIAVMYAGRLVETAPAKLLFSRMKMPYTRMLLDSLPRLDNPVHSVLKTINGQPPDLVSPGKGCAFAPRCPLVRTLCRREEPPLFSEQGSSHRWACWYPLSRTEQK